MRVAFLGSPPFADDVLASLVASAHEVAVVVTRPDRRVGRGQRVQPSRVASLARERSITVLQPATARDPSFVAALAAHECEALLVASYGEILKREMLELAPRGAFNVHASLLPRHRGASPIQAAILAGDLETGVTIQRMVAALDEGDVLLAKRTPISPEETASELTLRLSRLGGAAAVEALDLLERGEAQLTPQDAALATYCKKLEKDDGRVDWKRSAEHLSRFVRAMTDWPGARATLEDGRELVLLDVRPVDSCGAHAGLVLQDHDRFLVATGDGVLEIRELKPAGKAPMSGIAFLRGARLSAGASFR